MAHCRQRMRRHAVHVPGHLDLHHLRQARRFRLPLPLGHRATIQHRLRARSRALRRAELDLEHSDRVARKRAESSDSKLLGELQQDAGSS